MTMAKIITPRCSLLSISHCKLSHLYSNIFILNIIIYSGKEKDLKDYKETPYPKDSKVNNNNNTNTNKNTNLDESKLSNKKDKKDKDKNKCLIL